MNDESSKLLENFPKLKKLMESGKAPNIAILTPFYGGLGMVRYFNCLIRMIFLLTSLGIKTSFQYTDYESLVQRGRNTLVALALSNPEVTHVFFIDSDLEFREYEILKLLEHDKNLIGGIYPQKKYNFDKLADIESIIKRNQEKNNVNIPPSLFVKHNLLNYNLNGKISEVKNSLIDLDHIATGFMLIKRKVFNDMILEHPEWKYEDDIGSMSEEGKPYLHSFFDCFIHEKRYLSEDYGFCRRWKNMGGKIYADITIELNHIGTCIYEGRLLSTMSLEDYKSDEQKEKERKEKAMELLNKIVVEENPEKFN